MGINSKACVFASRPLQIALEELSKNTLIDFVVDLCRAELGEQSTDEQILHWVQRKIEPTMRHRGQKLKDLNAVRASVVRDDEKYRREHNI